MPTPSSSRLAALAALSLTVAALVPASRAAPAEPFPELRPANRAQAVGVLGGGGASLPVPCLTALVQAGGVEAPAPARIAAELLRGPDTLTDERRWTAADGTLVRYTLSPRTFDRTNAQDLDGDGTADLLAAAAGGVAEARALLVDGLGLGAPGPVEVLLARIGYGVRGYAVEPRAPGVRSRLVLEATGTTSPEEVRRAAIHQFAHVVGFEPGGDGHGLPPSWAESLALWAEMRLTGGPDGPTAGLLTGRLSRLAEGLITSDLELAAGNSLWLAFLEEAYGIHAVRLTVEELSAGGDERAALDRALRRAAGKSLAAALRSFQLWGLLVGERSDGRHFSFAERLLPPSFGASADGLPALSFRADVPVAPLGAGYVLLDPGTTEGGVRLGFEGDFAGVWEVDLVLLRRDGSIHRLPLELTDGRGETTIPLDGVVEVVMLVRNLEAETGQARGFMWTADPVRGFPFELLSVDARWSVSGTPGVTVSWETGSELGLLGFNVLRVDPDSGDAAKINPVWIPAIGGPAQATSYQFLDRGADPRRGWAYRIEGITLDGLSSRSDPVDLRDAPSPDR